jgi:hypothetical protein
LEEKKNGNVRKREKRKDKYGGFRLGEVEFHKKRESDVVLFGGGNKFSFCFEF